MTWPSLRHQSRPSCRTRIQKAPGDLAGEIIIPAELAEQCLEQVDPLVHRALETDIQRRLTTLITPESVVERVRSVLLSTPQATLDSISRGLGISSRSLQRKLDTEGTSFREIRDEVRFRASRRYLRAGHTAEEIADRLGFSGRRAFERAFVRWSGVTPTAWRPGASDRSG